MIPLTGNLLEYVCGTGAPQLAFDRVQRILSFRRRPGSDAVDVTPEESDDLHTWKTGPAVFVFAGETRDATGGLWQHWMVPALDAGPVIMQAPTQILDDETYGELQLRLSEVGALTLIEALTLMSLGEARETPQDDSLATYAPKVTRDDAKIDWALDATEVSRTIRAYDPKPGAFTTRNGADVKTFGPRVIKNADGKPGQVISADRELIVAAGNDAIRISDVQPSGRSRMTAAEWARGRGISAGDILGT